MIEWIVKIAVSYLLGSILGSLLIARLTGRPDIRTVGSGNPGSTNALRTQGKLFALGVIVIDVGKGWLATGVIPAALSRHFAGVAGVEPGWLPAACGAAVMVGHVYPLWHGFRGGKAVATFLGALLGFAPLMLIPVLLTWLAVVVLTGFVALGSMASAAVSPLCAVWFGLPRHEVLFAFGIFAAALIVFTHRSNISRMRAGSEPRARRLWLFGRAASRP